MAHKTLIGGTAYEIDGGKTLINGTAYSIDKGKTLVGGTAHEVGFAPPFNAVVDFGTFTPIASTGSESRHNYKHSVDLNGAFPEGWDKCTMLIYDGVQYELEPPIIAGSYGADYAVVGRDDLRVLFFAMFSWSCTIYMNDSNTHTAQVGILS